MSVRRLFVEDEPWTAVRTQCIQEEINDEELDNMTPITSFSQPVLGVPGSAFSGSDLLSLSSILTMSEQSAQPHHDESDQKSKEKPMFFHDRVKTVDFSKEAMPFSTVHSIRKLINLGDSVCKLIVGATIQISGTGFVLFDDYIMSNQHLFRGHIYGDKLTVQVKACFCYENAMEPNQTMLEVDNTIIDMDERMDYIILKIKNTSLTIPQGLLVHFGNKPNGGAACIIGHPKGAVKKIDLTYVIPKNEREEHAKDHAKKKEKEHVIEYIKNDNLLKSDEVFTYDTYMFQGASGSPMFDCNAKVVGIHSSGVLPEGQALTVIEYAHATMDVFEHFVKNLTKKDDHDLLSKIEKITKKNHNLKIRHLKSRRINCFRYGLPY